MLSRRSFLALVTGLVSWPSTLAWTASRRPDISHEDKTVLAALVGDTDAAKAIGRDALKSYPHRLNSESIKRVLTGLQLSDDGAPMLEPADLRVRYQAVLRRDFARSRIVDVQGWQLAETEVCLFAYLALESDSRTPVVYGKR